jgi:hypothetical protein
VLPLALYLLSFIICFDNPRWYARLPFTLALVAAAVATCWVLFEGTDTSLRQQIVIFSGALFVCCMICHGELYRLKPDPSLLTSFYLRIAAGGAIGGLSVAVLAPYVFKDYYELHWGLLLSAALFLIVWVRERPTPASEGSSALGQLTPLSAQMKHWRLLACALALMAFVGIDRALSGLTPPNHPLLKFWITGVRIAIWLFVVLWAVSWVVRKKFAGFRHWHGMACAWLFVGVITLGSILWKQARSSAEERIYASRNFYGVLSVYEYEKDRPYGHYFLLQHGGITHGLQFTQPEQAKWPTTYYGPGSGIHMAVQALPTTSRRLGVVGLGTGTSAAFGRDGDYLRIYEINPEVVRLANSQFTYVGNCPGKVEIALGDARLSMEREVPQQFDLLALDAFSSDAIPVHLLTKEAFELYQKHVKTNGIIAVHISNHYLDLEPVVLNLARHFNYQVAKIEYDEDDAEQDWWFYSSTWLLLTYNQEAVNSPPISAASSQVKPKRIPLWTDDFASLFQILQ